MSDRMTSIRPTDQERRAQGIGLQYYGLRTRAEMLKQFRAMYERELEKAQYALSLSDDELIVETFVGPWAQKHRKVVED